MSSTNFKLILILSECTSNSLTFHITILLYLKPEANWQHFLDETFKAKLPNSQNMAKFTRYGNKGVKKKAIFSFLNENEAK